MRVNNSGRGLQPDRLLSRAQTNGRLDLSAILSETERRPLNDNFSEGETEFLYQRRRIVPKRGSLLIAPIAFTHTHRGNRPKGGDKYIATSWILFQRAERLYGGR